MDSVLQTEDGVKLGYYVLGDSSRNEEYHGVMRQLCANNNFEMDTDVKFFGNKENISGVLKSKEVTLSIVFCNKQIQNLLYSVPCQFERIKGKKIIFYTVVYDSNITFVNPVTKGLEVNQSIDYNSIKMKRMVDEAIINYFKDKNFELKVRTKSYPSVFSLFAQKANFLSLIGGVLFFLPYCLYFIYLVNSILAEKQKQQDYFLIISGFERSAYWLSYTLLSFIVVTYHTCSIYLLGMLFQFNLFQNVGFLFFFVYLFLTGTGMMNLAFLIASAFEDKTGGTIAYAFVFIFIVFMIFFSNPISVKLLYIKMNLTQTSQNTKQYQDATQIQNIVELVTFILENFVSFNYLNIWSTINLVNTDYFDAFSG